MKNTFLLRNEFKQYLQDNKFPIRTISSYCSYVAGADRAFLLNRDNIVEESNLFEILKLYVESNDFLNMDSVIIEIIDELSTNDIDKILNTPIGYIRNWKSGLFQYREFLYDYIMSQKDNSFNENNIEIETPAKILNVKRVEDDSGTINLDFGDINTTSKDYRFTKNDLYKTFRFRILTQDRFYNDIYYPVSFIKRLLYYIGENNFIDLWITKVIENIIINTELNLIKFSDISELTIENNSVFVKSQSLKLKIYSKQSDNKTLLPFNVNELRKITIDHDIPLHKIMNDNIVNLPMFLKITNELKQHIKGTVNPKKLKQASNIVLKTDFIHTIDVNSLKTELTLLSSISHLQLMDSKQNLIKKKK